MWLPVDSFIYAFFFSLLTLRSISFQRYKILPILLSATVFCGFSSRNTPCSGCMRWRTSDARIQGYFILRQSRKKPIFHFVYLFHPCIRQSILSVDRISFVIKRTIWITFLSRSSYAKYAALSKAARFIEGIISIPFSRPRTIVNSFSYASQYGKMSNTKY